MGLHRKSRRLRIGTPEAIALALLGATLLTVGLWWEEQPFSRWVQVPAQVTGVGVVSGAETGAAPRVAITFTYTAGGRPYEGRKVLGTTEMMLYRALPKSFRKRLSERGYLAFSDLPEEIRSALEAKDITSFEKIPEHVVVGLHKKGYRTLEDVPEDVRDAVRREDHAAVAEAIERLVPGPLAAAETGLAPQAAATPGTLETQITATPGAPGLLRVRYNPADPYQYRVVHLFLPGRYTYSLLPLAGAVLSVLYCAFVYPRFKALRP